MDKKSNKEYIEHLKSILEKENEEIQKLENEIQMFQKNCEKNNSNIINFELKNLDDFQNKVVEDITLKINSFNNKFEKNIKEKISEKEKDLH